MQFNQEQYLQSNAGFEDILQPSEPHSDQGALLQDVSAVPHQTLSQSTNATTPVQQLVTKAFTKQDDYSQFAVQNQDEEEVLVDLEKPSLNDDSGSPTALPLNRSVATSKLPVPQIQWAGMSQTTLFARGSFGVVYKAVWRGAPVAVKVPTTVSVASAVPGALLDAHSAAVLHQAEMDLLDEARSMAKVPHHPHVLALTGVTSDPVGLVVPFAEGGGVDALLVDAPSRPATGRHTTSWRHAVRIMADAALGIRHLHREGVIHRDIAARNVLLDAAGRGLVSDFGMARIKDAAEGHSVSGTLSHVGPIKWESPERLAV